MATVMRASQAQRARVGVEEGNCLNAYQDTVGVWTIGKGHAATNPIPVRGMLNGEFYQGPPKRGVSISPAEVDRLFDLDMDETERGISALISPSVHLTQSQFDALCDFVHQYGLERFSTSTLLVKINFNPNNIGTQDSKGILHEFMRWDKAGGTIQEYVWRRSARRCCIYTGTLIPQKLWRKASTPEEPTDGYPFALVNDDGWKVDYTVTPTIDQILADGRRLSKPPEPVMTKSWPEIVGSKDATITIITDTPASPAQAGDKAGAPEPATQPAPASPAPHVKEPAKSSHVDADVSKIPPKPNTNPAATSSPASGPAAPVIVAPQQQAQPVPVPVRVPAPEAGGPQPTAPPSVSAKPPKLPDPPVPVGQQTSAVDQARRSEEWSANTKAMWQSRRFYGLVLIMAGRLWMLKTGSNAFLNQVSDPLVMEMVGGFGVMIAGEIIQAWGQKKATKALR